VAPKWASGEFLQSGKVGQQGKRTLFWSGHRESSYKVMEGKALKHQLEIDGLRGWANKKKARPNLRDKSFLD